MSEVLVRLKIEPLEEGGYLATSADLPELLAQGRTIAETMEIAQDVARKLVESYLEHGDQLPDVLLRAAGGGDSILEAKVPVSVAA
jgi:predicted RNase H-like HicB family nuclease